MSARPRVAVVSVGGETSMAAAGRHALEAVADVRYLTRGGPMTRADALLALRDADVVAATPKVAPVFDEPLLRSLPALRGLALYATGHDFLDVDLLDRYGVAVSVLPDYSTEAVAEHAIGLLLGLACRLHLANDRSRRAVAADVSLRGFELRGRTAGIVGVGRIGGRVAELAHAFGMRVVGHDRRDRVLPQGAMVGFDELLGDSDVVVVSCPYQRGQPPLIGPAELARIRAGAVLVNVGRAALVDHAAVADALRSRRLRGYAVDDAVYPPGADIVREGRVLQTGHSAWWRDEVLDRGGLMWADHTRRLAVGDPVDVVSPRRAPVAGPVCDVVEVAG